VYTYIKDRLNVVIYTKDGKIYDQSFWITKEKLIDDITSVNKYFSSRSLHRSPVLRGANPIEIETSTRLKNAEKHIQEIRELLLPSLEIMQEIEHLIIVPTLNIATSPFYRSQERRVGKECRYSCTPYTCIAKV